MSGRKNAAAEGGVGKQKEKTTIRRTSKGLGFNGVHELPSLKYLTESVLWLILYRNNSW
jgi:hypothetical protein